VFVVAAARLPFALALAPAVLLVLVALAVVDRLAGRPGGFAGGALLGLAGGARGRLLVAHLLHLHRLGLARVEVADVVAAAHGEEAEDRFVEAQRALELGDRLAGVGIEERQVVALLEALDLV